MARSRDMLKTLRVKFVAINMTIAAIVLIGSFASVLYTDYSTRVSTVYSQLEVVLAEATKPRTPELESLYPLGNVGEQHKDSEEAEDGAATGENPQAASSEGEDASLGSQGGDSPSVSAHAEDEGSSAGESDEDEDDARAQSDGRGSSSGSDADATRNSPAGEGDAQSGSTEDGTASDNDSDEGQSGNAELQSYTFSAPSPTSASNPDNQQSNLFEGYVGTTSVTAPSIGGIEEFSRSIALVAVYDIAPDGRYTTLADYTTATIPEATLLRVNTLVLTGDESRGYLREFGLYFERQPYGNDYLVAYADSGSVDSWVHLGWTLLAVGVAALGGLFLINIFFSRWALKPVENSIKQQQRFTSDASHELKTPLTVILANMAILSSQPNERVSDQMQWVESTQTEAERMQLLVNDMLALSRSKEENHIRHENMEAAMVKLDFSDLVEGEVLQFESVAFERDISIDSDIAGGLVVLGDSARLARMVATLIDNACKYAEKGTSIDIDLKRASQAGSRAGIARLQVHNWGTPIPEDDLPYVFDRFYRTDKARTSSTGGYGLGLAIGYGIAKDHNGRISVSSTAEEGTTFTVTLPLADEARHFKA